MYYNPVNNRVFFFLTTNSYYGFVVKPKSKYERDFRTDFISNEMRKRWEADPHVTRVASNNLAGWNG